MVDSRSGQSGVFAACPVVSEHKRGSDSVTSLCLLMVDVVVLVRTRRYAHVRESPALVSILLPPVSRSACASVDKFCPLFPCTVDGKWSEWSVWEECSRTCGQGNRTRVRTCSDPPAQHGGRLCEGKAVEVIMCSVRQCPGKQE